MDRHTVPPRALGGEGVPVSESEIEARLKRIERVAEDRAVALTYCVRLWRELERVNEHRAHTAIMSDLARDCPRVLDLLTERERELVERRAALVSDLPCLPEGDHTP